METVVKTAMEMVATVVMRLIACVGCAIGVSLVWWLLGLVFPALNVVAVVSAVIGGFWGLFGSND